MKRLLLAAPLLLVVAACGSKKQAVTVTVAPRPAPILQKARIKCDSDHLKIARQGGKESAFVVAAGSAIGTIRLVNEGLEPCSLSGPVKVILEPAYVLQTTPPLPIRQSPSAQAWLGSLSGNRATDLNVQWANWCVKKKRPKRLRIELPDNGGSLTTPAPAVLPKCFEISAPTTVSAIAYPALDKGRRKTNGDVISVLDAKILPPDGSDKLEAPTGGTLHYRVQVTNTVDAPLSDVPGGSLFAQQLAGGRPDVRVLPGAALRGLKAKHSVVYDLSMAIPALTEPGSHVLQWVFSPYTLQKPAATAPVTITAG